MYPKLARIAGVAQLAVQLTCNQQAVELWSAMPESYQKSNAWR